MIDDALVIRLSVYKNTWIDYDTIEKISNEHGWEVMGFNRDSDIESPMSKQLDLYVKTIKRNNVIKYVMIKDIRKKYWD